MATRYNFFGGLVTDGLVLDLDAAKLSSYPAGGTAWIDISGNGNNGVLTNGPTFSGVGKQASIVFDGVDDYVTKINPTNFPINSDLSVFSFFRKTGTSAVHQTIISTGYSSWNLLLLNQTTLSFNQAQIKTIITGSEILTNQWYYAGCTRSGNEFKLYLNGALVSTATDTISFTNNSKYDIGVDSGVGGNNSNRNAYFNGNIPVSQVYNRGISAFEIWQNFNAYKSRYGIPDIVTDGLVLNLDAGNPYSYYSPTSGTTWTDVSGNGNNGTLTNGPAYSNGAITFDGVDDYVSCGNVLFNNVSAVTISIWVNIQTFTNGNTIISKGAQGEGSNTTFAAWIISSSGIRNRFFNSTGTSGLVDTGTLSQNAWYNLTWTYNGSAITVYTNSIIGETAALSGPLKTNTNPLNIARSIYGNNAQMICSGTQIYNRALSQTEITQNFNSARGRYGI